MEKPELSSVSGSAFKAGSPAGSPVMEPEPLKTSSSSAPSANRRRFPPSLLRLLEGSPERFSAGLPEEFRKSFRSQGHSPGGRRPLGRRVRRSDLHIDSRSGPRLIPARRFPAGSLRLSLSEKSPRWEGQWSCSHRWTAGRPTRKDSVYGQIVFNFLIGIFFIRDGNGLEIFKTEIRSAFVSS